MIKKTLPYFIILLFLGWAGYRVFITKDFYKTEKDQNSLALDWDQLDTTSGNIVKEVPATIKTISNEAALDEKKIQALTKDEDQFEEFDRIEKLWLSRVAKIIGPANYPRYIQIRETNEKEKLKAYQDYHALLKKKYGDNFSYNISEDQGLQEKKINLKYLKEIRTLIGDAKFKAYIKARDEINEDNRKEDTHFQIEF